MSSDDDDDSLNDGQSFDLYTNAGKNVKDFRKTFKFNLNTILHEPQPGSEVEEPKKALSEPTASSPKKAKESTPDKETSPICKLVISDEDEDTVPLANRLPVRQGRSARGANNGSVTPQKGRGSRVRAGGRARGRGRLTTVEKTTINLLKEPSPEKYKPFVASNWSLDDTVVGLDETVTVEEEDDNYEISVKVQWKSDKIVRFPIRKYQKLASLFEHFAKQENIPQSHILLTLRDNIISDSDTPDSLKLTIASIIEGGITKVTETGGHTAAVARPASPVDEDSIELKVRTKDSKQPTMIRLKKTQKMMVMMMKFSEQMEIPLEKLKFSFDGDALDPNETPVDLDLEGGEMIDLVVLS